MHLVKLLLKFLNGKVVSKMTEKKNDCGCGCMPRKQKRVKAAKGKRKAKKSK